MLTPDQQAKAMREKLASAWTAAGGTDAAQYVDHVMHEPGKCNCLECFAPVLALLEAQRPAVEKVLKRRWR